MFPRITDKGNRVSRQNHRGVGIKAWRLIVRNLPYKVSYINFPFFKFFY